MPIAIDAHVARAWIERVSGGRRERVRDELAIEEPLEIRVDGIPLAVTMRTPGEDEELAVGFLAGEALIAGQDEVADVGLTADLAANTVEVRTRAGLRRDPSTERSFHLTSSCGVCGKAALEHVRLHAADRPALQPPPVDDAGPALDAGAGQTLDPALLSDIPLRARAAQHSFDRTGGLHATGLFDRGGRLLVLQEDVGRHNAMDKALGAMLLAGRYPLPGVLACLSGRVSFELVQKAVLARLAGLVAVGAPTSLAVELAEEHGLVLCGFAREGAFNVYAGADLIGNS